MVWIALAALTGLAIGFVLWPLGFRKADRTSEAGSGHEAAFYRAQLTEIGRDVERGLLPPGEAAAARAEAGRKLLATSEEQAPTAAGALGRRRIAAIVALAIVPIVSLAVYARVGAPGLEDAPLAERKMDLNAPGALEAAVTRIEAHLMKSPDDLRGWEIVAPVDMKLGRFPEAAAAYRNILRLGGEKPAVHAALGEALVAMAEGVVTADARAEFDKAGDVPAAKFYRALAAEQDGHKDEAIAGYKALLPNARGREPWMMGLQARLAALQGGAPAETKPGSEAPAFSAEQRQMIEGMVSGLASRLETKGGSAEEWGRLIRAYTVLQKPDKAREALATARKALGDNADIDALARELGI